MLKKFLDWLHRNTAGSGRSCIRRNCDKFHGRSPSVGFQWCPPEYKNKLIFLKQEENNEQTHEKETVAN